MTKHSLALVPLCLAALSSLTACDDEGAMPYCEDHITVLESLDDEAPNGVKPGDILRVIEGERSLSLDYVDQQAADIVAVEIDPGGEGSSALTFDLQNAGGEIRWIESEEVYPETNGPSPAIAVICDDRIEIDAELVFASEDGVFDEIFAVTVRVPFEADADAVRAEISHEFEPEELEGMFNVTSISPANPKRVDYSLNLRYPLVEGSEGEVGQPSGVVGGGAEYEDGKVVMYGRFDIATFGDWDLY